jgi:hypothetical protein
VRVALLHLRNYMERTAGPVLIAPFYHRKHKISIVSFLVETLYAGEATKVALADCQSSN